MSRYISKKWLEDNEPMWDSGADEQLFRTAIDSAPSIDIVRCDECKYNYGIAHNCEFNDEDIVCTYWESDGLTNIDFCSCGERSE